MGWGAVNALRASGGIVVLWDTRVLQLVEMVEGSFTISCLFKNVEDGVHWSFTGVYGPCQGSSRERLLEELGVVKWLWGGPWCVGGDFNVLRFPHERGREGRLTQAMRRFSQVIDDLELKDFPTQGHRFTWSGGLNG